MNVRGILRKMSEEKKIECRERFLKDMSKEINLRENITIANKELSQKYEQGTRVFEEEINRMKEERK